MGCCDSCGRVILVVINGLFSIVGILLLTVGCIVRFGTDITDVYLQDAYNAFTKALENAGVNADISGLNIGDLVGDATIAFIVIGAFFFLLGIMGCIGACCKVRFLLIVYTIILLTIFAAELVFVILLFTIRSKVDGWLRDPVVEELKRAYTGMNGTDAFTLAMNFVMHEFDCCGIDSYTEFNETEKWPEKNNSTVPAICCRNVSDVNCMVSPTLNNSYIEKGCYDAMTSWLSDSNGVMIGVGGGVAAVQLILILFSFVICCQSRNEKDDDKSRYSEDIPIQPYHESREATGHRNMNFQQESPPNRRYDGRGPRDDGRGPRDDGRGPMDNGYGRYPEGRHQDGYQPEPYRGRSDYYRGPSDGYRNNDDRRYQGYS